MALTKAQYVEKIMGSSNALIGEAFLPHLSLAEREAALADQGGGVSRDARRVGAGRWRRSALLDYADAQGIGCAVVTNAPRANADGACSKALGLVGRLPIADHRAELARAKPDPLPYLTGLAEDRGGRRPFRSPSRIRCRGCARRVGAGLTVVGMTTTLDEATLMRAGATIAVADFTDPRIVELIRAQNGLYEERRSLNSGEIDMRLAQIVDENDKRALVVTARGESRLVKGARTTYELAFQAIAAGEPIRKIDRRSRRRQDRSISPPRSRSAACSTRSITRIPPM